MNLSGRKKDILLLLLLAFAGSIIQGILKHPLKFDLIDQSLPWRYFIGECLQHHTFPYWLPYQDLGFPMPVDTQTWYPVSWLIGYFPGYDIYTIALEFIFCLFIAGTGMYRLCETLGRQQETAIIAAIAYMFCGFFVSNAQHMSWVVAGSWLPFVLHYFLRLQKTLAWQDSLKLGLSAFLLFTGGYPAFVFMLIYLLAALFVAHIIYLARERQYSRIHKLVRLQALAAAAVMAMSAGVLLSVYQVWPYLTRSEGVAISQALFGSVTPKSLISLLLPFASVKSPVMDGTDFSLNNLYISVPVFCFSLYGLTTKKHITLKIFLVFGVVALLASMGEALPVRRFLYENVPLMGMFRFPSSFRLFFMLSFILIGAYGIEAFIIQRERRRVLFLILILSALFLAILFVLGKSNSRFGLRDFVENHLFTFSKTSEVWEHIRFQVIIQLLVLGLLSVLFVKIKDRLLLLRCVAALTFADVVIAARLNAPYTVVYSDLSIKDSRDYMEKLPQGFPVPPQKNVIEVNDAGLGYGPFWRNLNIFHKQIAGNGYTPFVLKNLESLRDSLPQLFLTVLNNPPLYLSSEIRSGQLVDDDTLYDKKELFFDSESYNVIRKEKLASSEGDTVVITDFTPSSFTALVKTKEPQVLTLLQSFYPNWGATVNGTETRIYISNKNFMSVVVPAGESIVTFSYRKREINLALVVSVFSLLVVLYILWKNPGNHNTSDTTH